MAVIPDIPLSDRRLGVLGPIRMKPVADVSKSYDAAARAAGAGVEGLAGAASAYFAVKARQEVENADLAAVEFEEGWRTLHNGRVEYGPDGSATQVKGLRDYTARDYGEDENALTALAQYEKSFRETASYRKLGREGRERFDLRVRPARQRAMEQANALFDRDRKIKMVEDQQKIVACQDHRAQDVRLDATPQDFDAVAVDAGRRIAAAQCKPSIIDDSALLDDWLDDTRLSFADEKFGELGGEGSFRGLYRQKAKEETNRQRTIRLETILNEGLSGRIQSEDAFAMAGEFVDYLEGKDAEMGKTASPRVSAEISNKMRLTIEKYAERYAAGVQNRALEAKAVGNLDDMTAISQTLRETYMILPDGSRARAMLAGHHADMETACDKRATYEVLETLDKAVREGRYDPNGSGDAEKDKTWSDPSWWGYVAGTRGAKVFADARASFDESWRKQQRRGFAERRDANVLALRGEMLTCAASGQPQLFLDKLTKAVVEKRISGSDFTRLSKEFNDGWMKGSKDDPGQLPKRVDVANRLLSVVKKTFGENALAFTEAIERDEWGDVKLDKTGRFAFSPDASPEGVSYRRGVAQSTFAGFGSFGAPVTRQTETFTKDEMKDLLDVALQLAQFDGAVVRQDPITLRPITDPKGHRVDAVADFAAWCDRFRDGKDVLAAADEIARRGNYENRVREQGRNADVVRRERMNRSRPMEAVGRADEEE